MRRTVRAPLSRLLAFVALLAILLVAAGPARADNTTYVVQAGDTLFKLSVRFGVSMDALRAANRIDGDRIFVGQTLVIPDPNAPITTAPPASGSVVHVVQAGETLFTIGLKYDMVWTKIQAANDLVGTTVFTGQRLVIPARGSAAAPAAPAPTQPAPTQPPAADGGSATTYVVQSGDTLAKIGQRFGVAWPAIQAANNLPSDTIYVGQRLTIPAGSGSLPVEVSAPPPPAEAADGKRFLVDLSEQRLYAYEGDTMVRTTLISSGIARYPTVTGTYYIYLRYTSTRMRGPGYDLPNVPYAMYFYKGYGLHGTYWHNNFGTPMSHGCVNMPTAEAEWAYNWSTIGTPVIVQP